MNPGKIYMNKMVMVEGNNTKQWGAGDKSILNKPTVPMQIGPSPNKNNGTQPTTSPSPGFGLSVNYPTPGINLTTLFPTTPTTTISNTLHYRSTFASATNFGL